MSKVIDLIREIRKYEYKTLDGYKVSNPHIHFLLSKEFEMEMEKIGRENKSKLRKEAKGNPYLTEKLKKGECREFSFRGLMERINRLN